MISALKSRIVTSNISRYFSFGPIQVSALDHVCIASENVEKSVAWYSNVLGMKHKFSTEPHFWPQCPNSPAFMQSGSARVAILPVDKSVMTRKRRQFGDHFALQVTRDELHRAQRVLPDILKTNSESDTNISIEEADYGHQLSLFFHDLDNNVVELTTWVSPQSEPRL
jgi:catechol 2,3-dioxygenase-like lactoylglutathione lyase family enzyme